MSKVIKKAYAEEMKQGYNLRTAMEEASRCLLCHDAPCSKSCPAKTDPAKFIRSLRFRNIKGAAETIRENNPLAGCCAEVCPYGQLCEQACSRTGIDKPIEIGKLQKFLVEMEKREGMEFLHVEEKRDGKIACVGAGPASLACARELASHRGRSEVPDRSPLRYPRRRSQPRPRASSPRRSLRPPPPHNTGSRDARPRRAARGTSSDSTRPALSYERARNRPPRQAYTPRRTSYRPRRPEPAGPRPDRPPRPNRLARRGPVPRYRSGSRGSARAYGRTSRRACSSSRPPRTPVPGTVRASRLLPPS